MENIDKKLLEDMFGTDVEVQDLEAIRDLIDEWIAEIKDN